MLFNHIVSYVQIIQEFNKVLNIVLFKMLNNLHEKIGNHFVLNSISICRNAVGHCMLEFSYKPLCFLCCTHLTQNLREVWIERSALCNKTWCNTAEYTVVWQEGPILILSDLDVELVT